nr:MAG TPA: hypothetical protein [Caudoviricetes sp.]
MSNNDNAKLNCTITYDKNIFYKCFITRPQFLQTNSAHHSS